MATGSYSGKWENDRVFNGVTKTHLHLQSLDIVFVFLNYFEKHTFFDFSIFFLVFLSVLVET